MYKGTEGPKEKRPRRDLGEGKWARELRLMGFDAQGNALLGGRDGTLSTVPVERFRQRRIIRKPIEGEDLLEECLQSVYCVFDDDEAAAKYLKNLFDQWYMIYPYVGDKYERPDD